MEIPLAFADQAIIEEVSLPQWCELFDALSWPASLNGNRESLTYDSIVLAFQRDQLSDELLQAFEAIHDLGTPEGREIISELLADRQVVPGTLPQGVGERELALRLYLSQRNDGALAEVFSRAHVRVQEGNHRRFNDFTGKKRENIRNLEIKRTLLEQAILDHCQLKDLGNHVQLRVLNDDEGAYYFQIMRSHHMRTPLAVMEGAPSRVKIQYRPVHTDLIRYEPTLGRLRITARAASIVQCYRRIFGGVLFGDETFFDGPPVCSLSVLQERGREALVGHRVFGVGSIRMTECVWELGDRERLNFHAADCFDSIESLNLSLNEGQLLQAKFKVEITGKSARPVTVTIRVPSRIEISQVKYETLINEVLAAIGIRGAHEGVSGNNLWSLYPWRQTIGAWRDCFGADTDLLAAKKILKKTKLDSIEPMGHPGAGRILHAEQLSPVEFFGVSQVSEIPSQSLSATDLDGLELVVHSFQYYLRQILEITNNASPWQTDSWLLDLGVLSICGHDFRLIYALRQPPRDAAAQVKTFGGANVSVLLLPKGMKSETGCTEILLNKAIPDRQHIIKNIIFKMNLEVKVPALLIAPDNARLVIDARLGKIWFDKVEINELKPRTQPFDFVRILAKAYPATVNKCELSAQLSASRSDGDQTARSAKMAANKLIKAALQAKGLSFDDPFKSENGFFRLIVPAFAPDFP